MATQCFIGPGVITLQNRTASFSVVETDSGLTVGSFTGEPFKGNGSPTAKSIGVFVIGAGEFCATYPDEWGTPNCNCPEVPVLNFTSTRVLGSSAADPVINVTANTGDFPGSTCANPSNVSLCELQQILDALEGIQSAIGVEPDYTNILTTIQTAVESIDADVDALTPITVSVSNLETLVQTSNITLASIVTSLNDILSEAQSIDDNTDDLESLIGSLTNTLQAESDETQVIQQAILDRLNGDCTAPINVNVCGPDIIECGPNVDDQIEIMTQVTQVGPTDAPFPADYINGIDSGLGGQPFGGFPFTDGPVPNNKGYIFSEPVPMSQLPDCTDVSIVRVYFEVAIVQDIDSDGTDFGDQIATLRNPDTTAIPTVGVITAGVSNSLAGFVFFDPTDGEVNTITLDATTPGSLTLTEAIDAELAFATQAGDTTTILGVSKVVQYTLGPTCTVQATATKECNSDSILETLRDISDNEFCSEVNVGDYCYQDQSGTVLPDTPFTGAVVSPDQKTATITDIDGNGTDVVITTVSHDLVSNTIGAGVLVEGGFGGPDLVTITFSQPISLSSLNLRSDDSQIENVSPIEDGFDLNNGWVQIPNGYEGIDQTNVGRLQYSSPVTTIAFDFNKGEGDFIIDSLSFASTSGNEQVAYGLRNCNDGVVTYYDSETHLEVTEPVTRCDPFSTFDVPDNSVQLDSIVSSVQSIDAGTTSLEALLTAIDGNTQDSITEIQNAITELQAINSNTDEIEQLLTNILAGLPVSPPTAQEIADAIVLTERTSIEGRVVKITGTADTLLSAIDATLTSGTRGNLISISDTGAGNVAFSIDGSAPTSGGSGAQLGEATGASLSAPLRNIDLSLVRFDPTSGASDITVYYEVFLPI